MSDRQLRDEVVTLYLAGHETTAGLLTWALYWLTRRPDIAERVCCRRDAAPLTGHPDHARSVELTEELQVTIESAQTGPVPERPCFPASSADIYLSKEMLMKAIRGFDQLAPPETRLVGRSIFNGPKPLKMEGLPWPARKTLKSAFP